MSIVDARGRVVESQIEIAHAPIGGPFGARDRDWRAALERRLDEVRPPMSAALGRRMADRLAAILPLHRGAVDRLAQRETLLLAHARTPLARPLVQPGLFDRRAVREAAEARRIDERAVEDAGRRSADLQARLALSVREAELLAAVAIE